MYHIDMPQLTRIRRHIVEATREWTTATTGLDIEGEQLKRAPAGFPAAHEHIEDLKRKNLYTMMEFTEADVVSSDFLERFVATCRQIAPLLQFQTKALGLRW